VHVASSFVFTQRFFWKMSPSFHFFVNNFKMAGRRKLKFSHNVVPIKADGVPNLGPPGHVTKILQPKIIN